MIRRLRRRTSKANSSRSNAIMVKKMHFKRFKLIEDTPWKSASDRKQELEREKGIEPSSPAWKAGVLPLNYSRIRIKMGRGGFEPPKR